MAYVALYRQWRPKDFADLVGQDHISHTLVQAIKTGKIGHAYLFSGPRGTGKTSTAKILAKALNCEHGPTPKPCNKCSNCQRINANTFMDVYEIDAASNRGIDEIRDLRETVKFAPVAGKYKVYIIDEVHMLTAEAFNALLKTLEEPPEHVVFILATTEIQKVPATIQSRCQRYDFKKITQADIEKQLRKIATAIDLHVEDEALAIIAVHADGGMRDALSMLDQCAALSQKELTAQNVRDILGIVSYEYIQKITEAIGKCDTKTIVKLVGEVLNSGRAVSQLLTQLALYWRSMMIYKAADEIPDDYQEDITALKEQAKTFTHERLTAMINAIYEALTQARFSPQPRVTVEMALMKLCYFAEESAAESGQVPQLQMMEKKIAHLEKLVHQLTHSEKAQEQQAVADSAVEPSRKVAKPVNSMQPKIVKEAETVPQTNAKVTAVPESIVTPLPPTQSKDVQALWQKVLAELKAQHKIPALACVEKAQVCNLSNNQLVIAFKAPFLKARTEKADYKNLLENIMHALTQKDIKLVCQMLAPVTSLKKETREAIKKQKKKEPALPDIKELSVEEEKRLQNAVNIFGSNIIKKE